MIGQTLSHYKILDKLGAGGMGEVYRAEDTTLKRQVALKVLPEELAQSQERLERFQREAETLAALDHPNIVSIHTVEEAKGVRFLTMQLVEGKRLSDLIPKGGMPLERIFDVAIPLADALAAAHESGVVHRDLKPANIMVTDEGWVKVLDFGLAKLLAPTGSDVGAPLAGALEGASPSPTEARTELLTEEGKILGTVPYMSPEQLEGRELDLRSDIFALGVILYEMTTGERPFQGDSSASLISAIMKDTPREVGALRDDLPRHLGRIIRHSLEKRPDQRYQSALDVRNELQGLRQEVHSTDTRSGVTASPAVAEVKSRRRPRAVLVATAIALAGIASLWIVRQGSDGPAPAKKGISSLAVLPLEDLSGDPAEEFFADGMTDALITDLAKIGALKVISRTSAMRYKGTEKSLPEIARELNVEAVVEGSVLREGDRVRITAQLIEGATDRNLWAESYERELTGILTLQRELARAIAKEIEIAVTPEEQERLADARPIDPEVYELYLRGRYLCGKWTPEEMARAIQYLQQALEIDPEYASAHAELASCYTDTSFFGYLSPLEVYPRAKAAAIRAVEIDDRLAEAHTAIGSVNYQLEWSFLEAEQEFKQAIELNPNDWRALIYFAWMLGETGRFEEAMVQARRSQELDPLSVSANVAVAEIFYLSRNFDEAIKEYSKNLDLSPNDPAVYDFLAWPYEQKGMFEKAIALHEKAVRLSAGAPVFVATLGHANALAGERGEALKILDRLQDPAAPMPPSPLHIALVHIGLGNIDSAFHWLEEAYRERALQLIYLKVGPRFDGLRSDPRFDDLLRRLNLAEE